MDRPAFTPNVVDCCVVCVVGVEVLAVMAGSAVLGMAVLGCLSGFPAVGLSRWSIPLVDLGDDGWG